MLPGNPYISVTRSGCLIIILGLGSDDKEWSLCIARIMRIELLLCRPGNRNYKSLSTKVNFVTELCQEEVPAKKYIVLEVKGCSIPRL